MQIGSSVHALKIPFEVLLEPGRNVPRYVYVYAVLGAEIFLIDSGVASSHSRITELLREGGRHPQDVSTLILTHSHPDHIGGARGIQNACACWIAAHEAERDWIQDVGRQKAMRPVPGFDTLVEGSVEIDQFLADGDVLDPGPGMTLRVLHTPGHSPGSISLFLEQEGVLFTGDAIPQPGNMPMYDDVLESARSIRRLMGLQGVRFLLSSWDEPREGQDALKAMNEGIGFLREVHRAVRDVATGTRNADPMELCRRAVELLGLPTFAANALVARSLQSHLKVLDAPELEELLQ
jgi:glyoxylase-like metal-dependent hydrolase (beta-lactamase superfamily II)